MPVQSCITYLAVKEILDCLIAAGIRFCVQPCFSVLVAFFGVHIDLDLWVLEQSSITCPEQKGEFFCVITHLSPKPQRTKQSLF